MRIAEWKNCVSFEPRMRCWLARCVILLGLMLRLAPCALAEDEDGAASAAPKISAEELATAANSDLEPESWWEPKPIVWRDGMKPIELDVRYATHTVRDHTGRQRQLRLRSYNGGLVGPPIVFRAGDTVRVKVTNNLPPNPNTPADPEAAAAAHHAAMSSCPNEPHDFNTTNLHTHGLHISPKPPADDVLRSIEPGGDYFDHVFPILPAGYPREDPPAVHYPGTFWYHAHRHGSTAIQLASGMAGALILRGDVDEVPEIKNANERTFVLQQIAYSADGTIEDFSKLRDNWIDVVQQRTRINGRLYPEIRLRPGQIERWRMIDSGVFSDLPLQIVSDPRSENQKKFEIEQIAADGISFAKPKRVSLIDLGPGNRVDVLVKAPMTTTRQVYFLVKRASKYDLTAIGAADSRPAGQELLARIVVDGDPCRPNLPRCGGIPENLPAPMRMLPPIRDNEIWSGGRKEVTFSVKPDCAPNCGPPREFLIEGKCYDPGVVLPKFDLELGRVEEWTLHNTSNLPHPFHIHVNAFQLMDEGGVWRDTVMLPPHSTRRIRTRFERFDGKFVTHCHILTHEDLGMMQDVQITKKQEGTGHE